LIRVAKSLCSLSLCTYLQQSHLKKCFSTKSSTSSYTSASESSLMSVLMNFLMSSLMNSLIISLLISLMSFSTKSSTFLNEFFNEFLNEFLYEFLYEILYKLLYEFLYKFLYKFFLWVLLKYGTFLLENCCLSPKMFMICSLKVGFDLKTDFLIRKHALIVLMYNNMWFWSYQK
jgi:hypothetical protein